MENNTYLMDIESDTELARLQVQESLFNELIDLFPPQFVPGAGKRILDVACGPAGWLLKVIQTHQEMSGIGVDLSVRMIRYARAQAEARGLAVQLSIMDILQPWNFPDAHFDLVNARFINGMLPVLAWSRLFQECWRVLRPGGVVRHTEFAHVSTPNSPSAEKLTMLTYAAIYKAGQMFSPYAMGANAILAQTLKQVGFTNIILIPYLVDYSYGTSLHQLMYKDLQISNEHLKPFLAKMQVAPAEELDRLREEWEKEWQNKNFCGHWYLSSMSAVKP